MKIILTLILAFAGQPAEPIHAEVPSLEACHELVKQFTTDPKLREQVANGGQVAAGCSVIIAPTGGA